MLPDAPSRAKLQERQSAKYTEKYADYLDLGVIEWRKTYEEHIKVGKKAILFVMTDDTRNCDDVAAYLEGNYLDLRDAVLVIHTKNNGEISEAASGQAKEELEKLRKQANVIDNENEKKDLNALEIEIPVLTPRIYLIPNKSVFNRIVGDSQLELEFASFLEGCADVVSYAKNYMAVHFKLDYVNAHGDISNYYPDFLVKLSQSKVVIVETKGLEDLDVPPKMARLRQWCADVNRIQSAVVYDFVFVDEHGFQNYKPQDFRDLLQSFREYKV